MGYILFWLKEMIGNDEKGIIGWYKLRKSIKNYYKRHPKIEVTSISQEEYENFDPSLFRK